MSAYLSLPVALRVPYVALFNFATPGDSAREYESLEVRVLPSHGLSVHGAPVSKVPKAEGFSFL